MPLPDTIETVRTPRGERVFVVTAFGVLSLALLVVGIAARHYSPFATVAGLGGAAVCIRRIFHHMEEWDEEERHEVNRPPPAARPAELPSPQPGLKTVPRQIDALKRRESR